MWYVNENMSTIKPDVVDQVSSKKYVYIRKNFEHIEASGEGTEAVPEHWRWQETKIPKETLEIYLEVVDHSSALDDVYEALAELAEIIVGEE